MMISQPCKRESLAILATIGNTKEFLGVNMSLGDFHKLLENDVEKYYVRYQAVLGQQLTDRLVSGRRTRRWRPNFGLSQNYLFLGTLLTFFHNLATGKCVFCLFSLCYCFILAEEDGCCKTGREGWKRYSTESCQE